MLLTRRHGLGFEVAIFKLVDCYFIRQPCHRMRGTSSKLKKRMHGLGLVVLRSSYRLLSGQRSRRRTSSQLRKRRHGLGSESWLFFVRIHCCKVSFAVMHVQAQMEDWGHHDAHGYEAWSGP